MHSSCTCRKITATLLAVMSVGLTECLIPLAAYPLSSITVMHPLGIGTKKLPLTYPKNWVPKDSLESEKSLSETMGLANRESSS